MSSLQTFALQVIPFTICSRRIVQVICACVVILFSCLIVTLICIKSRSLFDLCMNILIEIEYWYLVVFHFCVFIAFMFFSGSVAIVLIRVLMCVCRILIKITYLLTYLLICLC